MARGGHGGGQLAKQAPLLVARRVAAQPGGEPRAKGCRLRGRWKTELRTAHTLGSQYLGKFISFGYSPKVSRGPRM